MHEHADADEEAPAHEQPARVATGNPQANEILGGGFPVDAINVVMGQPGNGKTIFKTIFVEPMVFHHANADRPIRGLTTMSEPLDFTISSKGFELA
jgi:archaellum biogenesis ATPase FlaH